MQIPKYWGNARIRIHHNGKQFTVKKYGWSDESQIIAEQHAQQRAEETVKKIKAGKEFSKTDRKLAYGGGDGLPIREEIIETHENFIITRNVYGSLCLNTPDVLFADIDFYSAPSFKQYLISFLALLSIFSVIAFQVKSVGLFIFGFFAALIFCAIPAHLFLSIHTKWTGGKKKLAIKVIQETVGVNPEWHLRLYETPNGYRVLVMHDVFEPQSDDTIGFMKKIYTDPLYTFLCKKQNCFRARISPKPWRIGIEKRLSTSIWPVYGEKLKERRQWVSEYNHRAKEFGSCRFIHQYGSNITHPHAAAVQKAHDELCRADEHIEIA